MVQPPSSTTAQYTQQFLNTVLSQRGLPYSEDVKWFIRQHLLSLTSTYPSLHPKTAIFTHNDGRSVNLLQADGTLPITFNTLTYNIPVLIWLMDTYPRHPPLVFVNPTRDMIIKRQHAFVNPSGLVSIPYLQNWVYPSSNLVDLARNLSHYFGLDPPLYSQQRRPNPNPNPNPSFDHSVSSGSVRPAIPSVNPNPSFDHSVSSGSVRPTIPSVNPNPSFDHSVSSGSVRPAIPPRSYPPSPYGGGRVEDPSEVYKRNAIGKLVESVHSDVEELRRKREVEMEGMFNVQAVLRRRGEEVAEGVREMEYEKEGLEQKLQMVLMNTDVLEGWLRVNDGKLSAVDAATNVDVDEAFEASDALSKQMMDCTAADLAIEDVVYALDKAVQEGSVAFDVYLRNVRLLSREQFFHRAMAAKVRGVQMQGYVTSMASRVSPSYGM